MKYSINLDWVELHCEFDSLLFRNQYGTPDHSQYNDFAVRLREYGTRVYKHVSTIYYKHREFATLCYCPLSSQDTGGIMNPRMCHIKLENSWCYDDRWFEVLMLALRVFRIKPKRVSRVDICCDVQYFECGLYAADLAQGLIRRKYYKIHQANWGAHGTDSSKLSWHSLSFGSKSSPVYTRFYNKSLELSQAKDKQYIREVWQQVGLSSGRDTWRIEFALTDTGREVIDQETGEQFDIPLQSLADKQWLQGLFFHYAQHYFDIRKNTGQRRYDCPRLRLLPDSPKMFIPVQRPRLGTMNTADRMVLNRLRDLAAECPNRAERFALLRTIRLYQYYRRVEQFDDEEMRKMQQWLYNMVSDDDKPQERTIFDEVKGG